MNYETFLCNLDSLSSNAYTLNFILRPHPHYNHAIFRKGHNGLHSTNYLSIVRFFTPDVQMPHTPTHTQHPPTHTHTYTHTLSADTFIIAGYDILLVVLIPLLMRAFSEGSYNTCFQSFFSQLSLI